MVKTYEMKAVDKMSFSSSLAAVGWRLLAGAAGRAVSDGYR